MDQATRELVRIGLDKVEAWIPASEALAVQGTTHCQKSITAAGLADFPDAVVLDVRSAGEFAEGHLRGAKIIALLGAALIGLSLGLSGAGGSIITLPVLVYLAGLPPKEAVGLSLFVVGAAALVGVSQRIRAGEIHFKAVLMFALSGMVGAAGGARLTPLVSGRVLMIVFAVLMLVVAINMLVGSHKTPAMEAECRPARCLLAGMGVGLLTGFIGVGGGFLLMPALVKFARLPLRMATGTSLAVISP